MIRRAVKIGTEQVQVVERLSDLARCPACNKMLSLESVKEDKRCKYCNAEVGTDTVDSIHSVPEPNDDGVIDTRRESPMVA